MTRVFLQEMVEGMRFEELPANWQTFNLTAFSRDKQLWDYQQQALRNAIRTLWKYYEDFGDFQPDENYTANDQRKRKLSQWYRDNGLDEKLDINLNNSRRLKVLLEDYYPLENKVLPYEHFINRACFWMATGSGKTLVIIKLIEVLWEMIKRGEIPPHEILVLTHRDDLIEQLKVHVEAFNAARSDLFIKLHELREYADVKGNLSLLRDQELTVFYYRSDNLSDEQKEKIVDFRNYENEGKWYVLLDEAHKGDKEDSKRQHIYAILSRNGFLFNFSATFTDPRDLVTTAFNFNLSEFIKAGYGKHIVVLEQETRAFGDKEDYSGEEKQKIVLKALILLAYIQTFAERIREKYPTIYHRPLLLTLVNSVNTEDADLKLFFRELERIAKGEVSDQLWEAAKGELWQELKERRSFMFEDDVFEIDKKTLDELAMKDLLMNVFNSQGSGDIEILVRPSNRQELAFKLKTSDCPFALIKIGDVSGWLKEELAGYEVNQSFEDEGYFQRLNGEGSDINILMGSRSFYEGWDSNRPNVIVYINIGTGTEAKKFILQSVGRGVRIEPLKNKRKRLLPLYNAGEVAPGLFDEIKDQVKALETLIIFGTNRSALKTVIEHLDRESDKGERHQLSLFVNRAVEGCRLLIPTYRFTDEPMTRWRELAKFEIAAEELGLLKRYVDFVRDDRVLLAGCDVDPSRLRMLQDSLTRADRYYRTNGTAYKNLDVLLKRILDYFSVVPEDFERLKELGDEIQHFKRIAVSLKDITELSRKVDAVKNYQDPEKIKSGLKERYECGEITLDEYTEGIERAARMVREEMFQYDGKRLRIRHIANHYYIPVILSDEAHRIDFIKHIIQTPSEIRFLNSLEDYASRPESKFQDYDWWMFSKLDESLDEVYIPYYSPKSNAIAHFKPDFIFWTKKKNDYYITFVDPKGIQQIDWQYKVDGYRMLFEEHGETKVIPFEGMKVKVLLRLFCEDVNKIPREYRGFWFDDVAKLAEDNSIVEGVKG